MDIKDIEFTDPIVNESTVIEEIEVICESASNHDETEEIDRNGLRKHYDAIILGTGLTESILACAISRTGRYVLHLDQNDFYGRNESCHSLESFVSLAQSHMNFTSKAPHVDDHDPNCLSIKFGVHNAPVFRTLYFKSYESTSTSYTSSSLSTSDDVAVKAETEVIEPVSSDMSSAQVDIKKLYPFNIDFPGSGLLLGSGIVVDSLIKSDVSKYLEFQAMEGLFFLKSGDIQSSPLSISSVPRSRGEVFKSELFNVLEKRALMKFLQLVSDWGRERDGIEASKLNEQDLASGRSLHRPQNKDVQVSSDMNLDRYHNLPFHQLLHDCNLSSKLQDIICYALCLYSQPLKCTDGSIDISATQGLQDLYAHLVSLGRFGEGAFLTPIYGIGDISQAFCRMCAVWTGIYVLRCGVEELSLPTPDMIVDDAVKSSKLVGDEDKEGEEDADPSRAVMVKAANIQNINVRDTHDRSYTCEKFICSVDDWPHHSSPSSISLSSILSYTSVYDGPFLPVARSVAVIPPFTGSIDNMNNIFIIQKDSSTLTVPTGYYSITILTEVASDSDDVYTSMMRAIIEHMLQAMTAAGTSIPHEVCSAITIRPLYRAFDLIPTHPDMMRPVMDHVALCGQTVCGVSMSSHVYQAEEIFHRLYPDEDFLAAFKEVDNGEGLGTSYHDIDEEYDFSRLEKALTSIEASNCSSSDGDEAVHVPSIIKPNIDDDSSDSSDE